MSRLPMYRQIADAIREQIKSGELSPGDALPTEAQLREEYSVSRVTVRQAIKLLVDQDVLESVQGSGTYVKEAKVNFDIYQLTSFSEKLTDMDVKPLSEVLAFEITKPSPIVAEALNISDQDRVYYVKRVRSVDNNPIVLEETWMPLSLFPDLTYQVMQDSKYRYIEEQKKMVIDRSEQEIIPVLPSQEVVEKLNISAEEPILKKINKGFLSGNVVFEYSHIYYKSSDYKFSLVARRAPRK